MTELETSKTRLSVRLPSMIPEKIRVYAALSVILFSSDAIGAEDIDLDCTLEPGSRFEISMVHVNSSERTINFVAFSGELPERVIVSAEIDEWDERSISSHGASIDDPSVRIDRLTGSIFLDIPGGNLGLPVNAAGQCEPARAKF